MTKQCIKCEKVFNPINDVFGHHAEINYTGTCCPYCKNPVERVWDPNPNPELKYGKFKGKTIKEAWETWPEYIIGMLAAEYVGPHMKNKIRVMLGQPEEKIEEAPTESEAAFTARRRQSALLDLLDAENEEIEDTEDDEEEDVDDETDVSDGRKNRKKAKRHGGWTEKQWEKKLRELKTGYGSVGPIIKRILYPEFYE